MTTIAYRDGVMASDSQATAGNIRSTARKMWLLPGVILGITGDLSQGVNFYHWVIEAISEDDEPEPPEIPDVQAMMLTKKGLWLYDSNPVALPILNKFYAVGSGAELALGAMSMGADAKTAVKIAAKWDVNTGGRIVTMSIDKLDKGR